LKRRAFLSLMTSAFLCLSLTSVASADSQANTYTRQAGIIKQSAPSPPAVHMAGPVFMAGPVRMPCVFPDAKELALLKSVSTVVAIGQADSAQGFHYPGISTPFTRHTFHLQSIVLGAASSQTLVIEEDGGVPLPILEPAQYLLFLSQSGSAYYITAGLNGAFPLRAKGVVRECPTFPATAAKEEAPGSGVSLQDFTKTLRSLPTVAVAHR
jgi:hypothetical protein